MLELFGQIIGGVGLFLIGTDLLRRGFEESAGNSLRRILSDFTDKIFKGLIAGFVVSSAVQSATAVICTLIGFVNARLMPLNQAVAVVYGANLGKISIALLLTLIGFKFSMGAYALPLLGVGAFLKIFLRKQTSGISTSFMGFGLLFLGTETLKNSIVLINQDFSLQQFNLSGQVGIFTYFVIGMIITFITQSSTSALVLTLSALAGGLFSVENGVALLIGENFGTISSTIIAAIGTTPSAKRLSAAHVAYNLACTAIGVAMLEFLVITNRIDWLTNTVSHDATVRFTLFYCVYIFLALLVMLPTRPLFVEWLENHFHDEKALGSPKFIDPSKLYSDANAVRALHNEIVRFGKISAGMLDTALKWQIKNGWVHSADLSYEEKELDRLSEYIHFFASRTSRHVKDSEIIKSIQTLSMSARHFEEVADLSHRITLLQDKLTEQLVDCAAFDLVCEWTEALRALLARLEEPLKDGDLAEVKGIDIEFGVLEEQKIKLRQELLNAGVSKKMSSSQTIILIDLVDSCRRALRDHLRGIQETWGSKEVLQALPDPNTAPPVAQVYSI